MKVFRLLILFGLLIGTNNSASLYPQQSEKNTPKKLIPLNVENLDQFITQAGRSTKSTDEQIRQEIHKAQSDTLVLDGLIGRFQKTRETEYSRALIILSIIGEMKSPRTIPFFENLLDEETDQPTENKFEYLSKRDLLEMLQSSAIRSLAYLQTQNADSIVLNYLQWHPAIAVRTAGIDAYLYNHGDTEEAKGTLRSILNEEDWVYLDRVRKSSVVSDEQFNLGLEQFYEKNPEQVAPDHNNYSPQMFTNIGLIKTLFAMTALFMLTFLIIRKIMSKREPVFHSFGRKKETHGVEG